MTFKEKIHRIILWLKPLCSACLSLHVRECRDVCQGDYWQCAAGIHGYEQGTIEQEKYRQEIAKWMWHGPGAFNLIFWEKI
jgi:hypothetical protein